MLLVIFFTAFISATLWPMASEAVVIASVLNQPDQLLMIFSLASLGNTLGAITMYELARWAHGSFLDRMQERASRFTRWQSYLKRYGSVSLAFAWVPIIGDVLPIIAGLGRWSRIGVYAWLLIGKASRYAVILFSTYLLM